MGPWRNRIVSHGEEAPDQLLANPKNWRIHPKAQQDALSGVLDEVGWVQEVIVNKTTGHVVDGHLRVSLAISRQELTIPVKYVELTPEEEALVLATLDPLAGMAATAKDALESLLADVQPGSDAIKGLLEDVAKSAGLSMVQEGLTDPDAVPEDVEPIAKRGDVWVCGDHRVMCGDSTDEEDVARLMAGERAGMMWTDPPYGVSYVGKTRDAMTLKNDGEAGLARLLADSFAVADTILVDGAPWYVARPAGGLSVVFGNAIIAVGWHFHEELQWVKDSMVLGHSDYHLQHETVIYGWRNGETRPWYGGRSQTSTFSIPRPKASREHPTAKPVELVRQHVANSSAHGAIILDPFLGSGTTMIAAERLGRRCYGMEIAENYVSVAVKRWQDFTGRDAVLEATGETFAHVAEHGRGEPNKSGKRRGRPAPSSAGHSKDKS